MYNKNKIYLLSYGDSKYKYSKMMLEAEAFKSNFFDNIFIYGPKNLSDDFKNIKGFFSENTKGKYLEYIK